MAELESYRNLRSLPGIEAVIAKLYAIAEMTPEQARPEIVAFGDMAARLGPAAAWADLTDATVTNVMLAGDNGFRVRDDAPLVAAAWVGVMHEGLYVNLESVRMVEEENIEVVRADGPSVYRAENGVFFFEEPVYQNKQMIRDESLRMEVDITANQTNRTKPLIVALRKRSGTQF